MAAIVMLLIYSSVAAISSASDLPKKPISIKQKPWRVIVEGGTGMPIPSNSHTVRGMVGLGISRIFWSHLDIDLAMRLGISKISTDIYPSSRAGFRLDIGPLTISTGCRLGYVSMYVHKGALGALWTGALLIKPGINVSVALGQRFELDVRLITVSAYWNELWFIAWEPSMGLGVRF